VGKTITRKNNLKNGDANKLSLEDRPAHDWFRFVLSYPPHLVRDYLERFGVKKNQRVLDPFCGTGTTVVECKKCGIESVGVEANPVAHFASQVKLDWSPMSSALLKHASGIAEEAWEILDSEGIEDDPIEAEQPLFSAGCCATRAKARQLRSIAPENMKLLLSHSISPLPLHKTLLLIEQLECSKSSSFNRHETLALAKAIVFSISNLHFGPEVGVAKPKKDAPVISSWLNGIRIMADDLKVLRSLNGVPSMVHHADSRQIAQVIEPKSIDAVITSPPYPNEKDYTRTTRLESILLGFVKNKDELRALKKGLVRSNTRSVYKEDADDHWVAENSKIQKIARDIEARRIEMGKTSGFERMYHRVTKLYFGGMARHFADLRAVLKPGARLAYVVGDQASYLRIMIRTGELLAEIAKTLGYDVVGIDLFRTRLATATKEQLREEVVLLRWPG
jgi:DNA modification methylase